MVSIDKKGHQIFQVELQEMIKTYTLSSEVTQRLGNSGRVALQQCFAHKESLHMIYDLLDKGVVWG